MEPQRYLGCPGDGRGPASDVETHGAEQPPELYEPNPRQVSRDLLRAATSVPVPHLNVLVPARQSMVHALVEPWRRRHHEPRRSKCAAAGDYLGSPSTAILRTLPDDRRCPADQGQPVTYRNTETHWWDGSQLYGSDLARQRLGAHRCREWARADGKIHLRAQGHLPVGRRSDIANLELRRERQFVGWVVGHMLFARARTQCDRGRCASTTTADGGGR